MVPGGPLSVLSVALPPASSFFVGGGRIIPDLWIQGRPVPPEEADVFVVDGIVREQHPRPHSIGEEDVPCEIVARLIDGDLTDPPAYPKTSSACAQRKT